jgi:putative Mn2+ efflux pump MntP
MTVTLVALVLPLGLDTFAVAAALGAIGVDRARRNRVTVWFALFEGGMPLLALAIGTPLGHAVGAVTQYAAAAILLVFGIRALRGDDEDPDRLGRLAGGWGTGAVLLGLSISLDEFAIGLTVGLLHLPVALVTVLIVVQAVLVTRLGLALGRRVGERLRERAERLAGVMLIALAIGLIADRAAA